MARAASLLVVLLLIPALAHASETADPAPVPFGVDALLDFAGRYVWRGYDINGKKASAHASVTDNPAQIPGLSVNLYSSVGTGPGLNEKDVDGTVLYKHALLDPRLQVSVGGLWYQWYYPTESGPKDDFELTARLDYSLLDSLIPYVAGYRGLDRGIEGYSLEAGAAAPLTLSKRWSSAPSVQVGYSHQYGVGGRISYVGFSLPATVRVGAIGVTPYFNVVAPVQDLNDDGKTVIAFAGTALSYSF